MKKSKTGLDFLFFLILTYFFVLVGNYTPLLLIMGFALLYEKNEWFTNQVTQIIVFRIAYDILLKILAILYELFKVFLGIFNNVKVLSNYYTFHLNLMSIIHYSFIILLLLFLINLIKNKKLEIPIISKLLKKIT